jgi:hypothetical protein
VVSRQRRLNCFYEVRADGDKHNIIVRGTPGTATFVTLPTFPIRGWHVVNNVLYVVSGSVLYSVTTAGVYTVLGYLTNSSSSVSMADNGLQLAMVDGASLYIYTLVTGTYNQSSLDAAGSFGQMTADANFPAGATAIAVIDSYFVVNQPNSQHFFVSGTYDGTLWTNVSDLPTFGTKNNTSDLLVALDVLNGMVVLWGAQSIEFWQDVGSFPLPFQRITGSSQTWGLAAVNSRIFLNNTMIFLGQNPQGGVQVMTLNGYVPNRVSTSDIENLFSSFTTYSDAVALTYLVDGHPMYQLTFPTAGRSFLYDSLTGFWSEVQTGLALLARHYGNLGIAFNAFNYMSDYSTGNIYLVSSRVYTDNGMAIKRQVTSEHIHADGNEMGISELWLDMETGVGTTTGAGSDPKIMLQVSRDGGRTFGQERWKKLGKLGQYLSPRVIWRRLGAVRDFVFQFTMTDPVKFTIVSGSATRWQEEGKNG